jgi:hypothetical protein
MYYTKHLAVHQLVEDLYLKAMAWVERPLQVDLVGTAEAAEVSNATLKAEHQLQAVAVVMVEVVGMEGQAHPAEVAMKTETPNDLAIKRGVLADVSNRCAKSAECFRIRILGDLMSPPKGQVCTVLSFSIIQQPSCAYVISPSINAKRKLVCPGSSTGTSGRD